MTPVKYWSLLVWVTQFGFSALFPVCFALLLGAWLQNTFGFGLWVMILCGILGVLTAVKTVSGCIRSLRRDAEQASDREETPVAFNEHE